MAEQRRQSAKLLRPRGRRQRRRRSLGNSPPSLRSTGGESWGDGDGSRWQSKGSAARQRREKRGRRRGELVGLNTPSGSMPRERERVGRRLCGGMGGVRLAEQAGHGADGDGVLELGDSRATCGCRPRIRGVSCSGGQLHGDVVGYSGRERRARDVTMEERGDQGRGTS